MDVFLTRDQLDALANEAKYPDIILLLGLVGLRWGELAALRPRDLSPLRNRIHISRSASKAGNKAVITDTKTHETRTVAVPPDLMEMVERRARHLGSDDLLYPRPSTGGPMLSPGAGTWFSGAVERCMKADPTFPRVTPHGLRHVAAGLMIEAGANVKQVQQQLGHASATMTLDTYAALWDDGLDGLMEKMRSTNVVEMSWSTG